MNIPSRVKTYLSVTFLYGFVRGIAKNYDSTHTYYDYKTARQGKMPKLLTEKAGSVLQNAFIAPLVWPGMLGDDMIYMELYMRNEEPAAYGRSSFRQAR